MAQLQENDKNSWNAARILYEIYGADALSSKEWASLEACPPAGYDKNHQPKSNDQSIYGKLTQKWRECDPVKGDYDALIQSGLINEMRRIPYKDADKKIPYSDDITQTVVKRIEKEPFKKRTSEIHKYMDAAEKAVEKRDSLLISEMFESEGFIDHNKLPRNSTRPQRVEKFNGLLRKFFTFGDIYESIIKAELELMRKPLDPAFFRIKDIKRPKATQHKIQEAVASVNQEASKLMHTLTGNGTLVKNIDSLEGKYFTFLGGGSLPVSGILLHIHTGAKINLIDLDPEAITLSRRLIENLEKLGIIESGAIQVYFGDAKEMRYQKPLTKNADELITAEKVREIIKSSSTARFMEDRVPAYRRSAANRVKSLIKADESINDQISTNRKHELAFRESSVDVLADDTFKYEVKYTLPDKNTPYAISFTGYKEQMSESGEPCQLVHQIYFNKENGWKQSSDRRLIPTNVISFAMMLPPKVREDVMNRILEQTDVPDTALMRSVKGPAEIFYKPTRTSLVSSLRGPFYGQGVLPALVNRVEIYHLPLQQLFRGQYPDKIVLKNDEQPIPKINELERLQAMKGAIKATTQKVEKLNKLVSRAPDSATSQLYSFVAKQLRLSPNGNEVGK